MPPDSDNTGQQDHIPTTAALTAAVHALIATHGYDAVWLAVDAQGVDHGTIAGARWHDRRGVERCDECKRAWADYYRERRVNV